MRIIDYDKFADWVDLQTGGKFDELSEAAKKRLFIAWLEEQRPQAGKESRNDRTQAN